MPATKQEFIIPGAEHDEFVAEEDFDAYQEEMMTFKEQHGVGINLIYQPSGIIGHPFVGVSLREFA